MNMTDFIEQEKGIFGKSVKVVKDVIPHTKAHRFGEIMLGVAQHEAVGILNEEDAKAMRLQIAEAADKDGIRISVDQVAANVSRLTRSEKNMEMLANKYGKHMTNQAYRRGTRNLSLFGLGRGKDLPDWHPNAKKEEKKEDNSPHIIEGKDMGFQPG